MKSHVKLAVLLSTAAAFALPTAASAQAGPQGAVKTQTGSVNGLSFIAKSLIVGQTSTATVAGGGDPLYLSDDRHRGTVGLLMTYANGDRFVCSGSLSANGTSIITAGHCVSNGQTRDPNLVSVTAYFYDGNAADEQVYGANPAGVTTVDIAHVHVNPNYTGEVIDQNDIAVLRLDGPAPDFATRYSLYNQGDLTGQQFNVAGYGARSDTGGDVGNNLGTGRLRQGENVYDYAWGDDAFNDFFTNPNEDQQGNPTNNFFGNAEIEFSYVSDFDNGTDANDAGCLIAQAVGAGAGFCDTGLGAIEVGIAGGDSGGPQFINGQLAGVNSYGVSFGTNFGDIDGDLNSGFGEFSGYVPTFIHADWIAGVVPEPATWAMLIFGFGMVGGSMRSRKRNVKVSYA